MKIKAPIVTLGAGLVVAGVLYTLNVDLSNDVARNNAAASQTTTQAPPAARPSTAAPPAAPPSSAAPPSTGSGNAAQQGTVTYAGTVDGGAASLGIVVNNGKAIAYVCDGKSTEAWMDGSMANGEAQLSGAKGTLAGTYGNGQVTGTVTAGKKSWTFTVNVVTPPSGLYRSQAALRGKLDASWVVLGNGTQVGVETRPDGTVQGAPPFDMNSKTVTVNGTQIPIESTSPATGN
jgi:hypothetical protein